MIYTDQARPSCTLAVKNSYWFGKGLRRSSVSTRWWSPSQALYDHSLSDYLCRSRTDLIPPYLIQLTWNSHLALQKNRPLILVFAGPSGHGKTELARKFGGLMSLDLQIVDCTIFKYDNELFGPRPPYSGHEEGSVLNNFLASKAGRRCIVFMDEFEKTSKDIHNTLLLPFQNGPYNHMYPYLEWFNH